jgi:hypothetical protein
MTYHQLSPHAETGVRHAPETVGRQGVKFHTFSRLSLIDFIDLHTQTLCSFFLSFFFVLRLVLFFIKRRHFAGGLSSPLTVPSSQLRWSGYIFSTPRCEKHFMRRLNSVCVVPCSCLSMRARRLNEVPKCPLIWSQKLFIVLFFANTFDPTWTHSIQLSCSLIVSLK